ncbi:SDR family oxidoreductase [Sulfidibacter corallicola]|uniref:SDR family oxidoreductase n=1 Tax=Sulfidibacter corallicola TaxID=2818388 RepID=A0A8A4TN46_SULCO|nr:SDR family oxidoreductase [Sulfidibacter corallicola]QTD50867.1 SDR family oxidoreductase [Sulfidibacter corallicola]
MGKRREDTRVVLVTGASTGIGLALARVLLSTSFRLVLTARAESLQRFVSAGIQENERIRIRPLDLTQPLEADLLIEEIDRDWGGVDILVNNAGICYRAVVEHLSGADEQHQLTVNFMGPMHLIRLVLPSMRARRRGHIINLSSVGGMMAMPTMGAYSASKFALEGVSEALWYEMRPWGVHVTLIEPGFVHSSSFENALFTQRSRAAFEDPSQDYHPYYTNMIDMITKLMYGSPTTPEDIARRILRLMRRRNPPLRVAATLDAHLFALLRRLLPSRLYHWILLLGLPKRRRWVAKLPNAAPSQDESVPNPRSDPAQSEPAKPDEEPG